jgi:transcription antitermination factor NusG
MNNSKDKENNASSVSKPIDLTHDLDDLDAEEKESRRLALMDMLEANQARRHSILRNQRPTMALGETIMIIAGELAGSKGIVLDADFISSRVQLDVDGENEPIWLPFDAVGQIVSTGSQ